MKQQRVLAVLALLIMLIMQACTAPTDHNAQTAAIPGEKTVIHYYDTSDSEVIAGIVVQTFNAQSQTTEVVLHILDNEEYDDKIGDIMRGGDADCCYIRQPCQVNEYSSENLLWDLTGAVANSELQLANYGQMLDVINVKDTISALPRTKSVWLLIYNQDILDEMGVELPKIMTWDEYAEMTLRLTHTNDEGQMVYGGYIPTWTLNLGGAAAGEYLYDDELPYTKKWLELLDRLYNTDGSHPNTMQMEDEYTLPNDAFLQEKIATMINGDWVVYLFQNKYAEKSDDINWGILPMPIFNGIPVSSTVGSSSYLAVMESCEHKENAFEFISFFCGESAASMLADLATCNAYYTSEIEKRYRENADIPGVEYVFSSFVRNEEGAFVRYRELSSLFSDIGTSYLCGELSLEDAFSAFEKQRLPILRPQ